MSSRQGIEIDYCPQCRGVWLDRGELDKIIERTIGQGSLGQGATGERGHGHDDRSYGKRRRGFLGELFD